MSYQGPERRSHSEICEQRDRITSLETNAIRTDENVERIERRVEEIRESQIRIEQSSIRVETFGNKIFEVMYGKDDRGGLISSLRSVVTQSKIHWFLIGLILTAIIALFLKH